MRWSLYKFGREKRVRYCLKHNFTIIVGGQKNKHKTGLQAVACSIQQSLWFSSELFVLEETLQRGVTLGTARRASSLLIVCNFLPPPLFFLWESLQCLLTPALPSYWHLNTTASIRCWLGWGSVSASQPNMGHSVLYYFQPASPGNLYLHFLPWNIRNIRFQK